MPGIKSDRTLARQAPYHCTMALTPFTTTLKTVLEKVEKKNYSEMILDVILETIREKCSVLKEEIAL